MSAGSWQPTALGELLERVSRPTKLNPSTIYTTVGVRWYAAGVFAKEAQRGVKIAAPSLNRVQEGDIIYSRLFAWKGSFGVVHTDCDGFLASNEFPTYRADPRLLPAYFEAWCAQPALWEMAEEESTGTTSNSRNRLSEDALLAFEIDLPPVVEQQRILRLLHGGAVLLARLREEREATVRLFETALNELLLAGASVGGISDDRRTVSLREIASLSMDKVAVDADADYKIAGVLNAGRGLFWRDAIKGSETKYQTLTRLRGGQLVYRKLTAWEGPITVAPEEFDGAYVSNEFPTFDLSSEVLSDYMRFVCMTPAFWAEMKLRTEGTAERRSRMNPEALLDLEIDLPPLEAQAEIAVLLSELLVEVDEVDSELVAAEKAVAAARTVLLAPPSDAATRDILRSLVPTEADLA